MRHRRLYRREIYERLERLRKKWYKLSYPRFVVQAEDEINPERTIDPHKNFSIMESVRGYLGRLYINPQGRPDAYVIRGCNNIRRAWNEDPAHHTIQIYRVKIIVKEFVSATKRKPESTLEVFHNYLQTLRGPRSVQDVVEHIDNEMGGLEQMKDRISDCTNIRRVDRSIAGILQENERIQFGD